jgi:hypothetical protein
MKLDRFRKPRTRASLAISIALHVVLISALFSIVFRYPLGQLIGIPEPLPKTERLTFVKLEPQATAHSGRPSVPEQGSRPAALTPPTVVPDDLPVPVPDSSIARAAGGDGRGKGVAGAGMATGVVPMTPDSRIDLAPGQLQRPKETVIQTVDGIIELVVGIAIDSLNMESARAKHPEWIKKGKNGSEWGLSKDYIALGKFKIPTALLALTPMNRPGPISPIEGRRNAWIRRDVLENAQRSISEDEFRAAVKRIRERKERERKEKQSTTVAAEKPIPLTP